MYLLPIHLPIYVDGDRKLLTSEWAKALELLRDSLQGHYGPITLAAPSLPASTLGIEQTLVPAPDSINLFASFDLRCRARQYWMQHRPRWRSELNSLVARAEVVHGGMDDVYRPIGFEGFRVAVQHGKPALFVADTDIVLQHRQLYARSGLLPRAKAGTYARLFERACRWGVSHAALSLLKGTALIQRYGRYARNAREFHDTSFSASDIIGASRLEQRLATLEGGRPLRLVYCGRLVARKGVDRSIQMVTAAIARGCAVEFDIIGDGPERTRLEQQVESAGAAAAIRFLGVATYGSELLAKLAGYDGLLFTPTAEDTPRMIFDGYAAGLPLIGFDIGYVIERAEQEQATVLLPQADAGRCTAIIEDLARNPGRLKALARKAREAAFHHSAESWYQRRAEWTFEAVARSRQDAAA